MNLYFLILLVFVAGLAAGFGGGAEYSRRVLSKSHAEDMQRLANLLNFGKLDLPQAVRLPPAPDAMRRVHKEIHDSKVTVGARNLKKLYEDRGIPISDEEAKVQVEAMLAGHDPIRETVGA